QIDRAARAYLEHGAASLDVPDADPGQTDDGTVRRYARTDGMLPIVREVPEGPEVGALLARYIRAASRQWHMGCGACGVLVPMPATGKRIAEMLHGHGIAAEYVESKSLDLSTPTVKVLTLKSAKGLEFPFVAVAGFQHGFYPNIFAPGLDAGELEIGALTEALACERRSIYVGMTRAMLALMMVVPPNPKPPVDALYHGFSATYWNTGDN
ncbi:MAG: 3'-5' exonuclease, partial [Chloroflexota bacterium]